MYRQIDIYIYADVVHILDFGHCNMCVMVFHYYFNFAFL